MSVDVLTETVIDRPVTAVAAFAGDPVNAPRWYVNIESADLETAPPVAVGSRIAFVARFLGRAMRYTYEVTELIPDERLVMRTAEGPFPMETTYTWHATADGGTQMTLRNRGQPAGVSKLVAPLVAHAMRRANTEDLALLKKALESQAV